MGDTVWVSVKLVLNAAENVFVSLSNKSVRLFP